MGKEDVERHCDAMLNSSHNKNVPTIVKCCLLQLETKKVKTK